MTTWTIVGVALAIAGIAAVCWGIGRRQRARRPPHVPYYSAPLTAQWTDTTRAEIDRAVDRWRAEQQIGPDLGCREPATEPVPIVRPGTTGRRPRPRIGDQGHIAAPVDSGRGWQSGSSGDGSPGGSDSGSSSGTGGGS